MTTLSTSKPRSEINLKPFDSTAQLYYTATRPEQYHCNSTTSSSLSTVPKYTCTFQTAITLSSSKASLTLFTIELIDIDDPSRPTHASTRRVDLAT